MMKQVQQRTTHMMVAAASATALNSASMLTAGLPKNTSHCCPDAPAVSLPSDAAAPAALTAAAAAAVWVEVTA